MYEKATHAHSDEELLACARTQPWLFSILLDRYQDAFLRKARTILDDTRDAEEVVQDAFVKIYTHAHRFEVREGASFSSWAYRILINAAFTRYRTLVRKRRREAYLDDAAWTLIAEHASHGMIDEDKDMVERILEDMPPHLADPLRRHYLERWPQKDLAAEKGEDVGAVKARVYRAKQVFRRLATERIE